MKQKHIFIFRYIQYLQENYQVYALHLCTGHNFTNLFARVSFLLLETLS